MNEPMNEIIPGLYLGDIFAARNPSYLRDHGVTHILTVARGSLGLLSSTLESNDTEVPFKHRQIELDDLPDEKLLDQLENGVYFIDGALSENSDGAGEKGKILVHCLQGMSRSTSFVVAYLVWKNKITVGSTLEIVQEKRKKARPNSGFYRQLLEWEARCKEKEDS
ncbi:hypothetical protein TWF481_001361 [Arthrobotrys musiformis]|uniref:protein-tyrosine-phosphatase n=1 Tax=Arthrobotrys musiformis TaxID=47236 RepID=A0AAV9WQA7_9PEZI